MTEVTDVADLQRRLDDADYLVDEGLATALYLARRLGQPLLLEGEPGVGKTTAAKALASALGAPLIRLQCYEGITAAEALYEWNYPAQLLAIRAAEVNHERIDRSDLFTEEFLLDRPLLASLRSSTGPAPVLLIDEVDRADDEFEALLFEFLAESAISIPELGTVAGERPPTVILTSNRSRELHDALKRRCFYHWIDYPDLERATSIVRRRVPSSGLPLVDAASAFVSSARRLDLDKPPGLSEVIDWVSALAALGIAGLDRAAVDSTLGSVVKTPDDRRVVQDAVDDGSVTLADTTTA